MACLEELKQPIWDARDDLCVCLLGTIGPDGPNISPKSSMINFDDRHLAYWERARLSALDNLRTDPRVVVFYWNWKAFDEGISRLRFEWSVWVETRPSQRPIQYPLCL